MSALYARMASFVAREHQQRLLAEAERRRLSRLLHQSVRRAPFARETPVTPEARPLLRSEVRR